jgi:hypothetical protein
MAHATSPACDARFKPLPSFLAFVFLSHQLLDPPKLGNVLCQSRPTALLRLFCALETVRLAWFYVLGRHS